ncbi:glycosyltransferase [Sphingomonas sp.]|uniref:glycosyltransferase n=1 Tax=Sphingomonas sp. TaxID=28214 RepID=UPI002CCDDE70|nr:glycosyltransferase [Sphingomonas sp.]HWK36983.1 glycosyltransferase [Sphingomonas sp.]
MIGIAIGALTLAIWLYLLLANGGFWLARERDTAGLPAAPPTWPEVVAVVPARDEAEVIATVIASLAAQDYPGDFRIVLIDDGSSDGTATLAAAAGGARLTVVSGVPLVEGWTGKLWAVSQGIAAAGTPRYLWLTDADIAHAPDTLRSLVTRAEGGGLALVSLMAKLRCVSFAERALVPAFVYFFEMLYPFARVNAPRGIGAAAGGCMLVRRDALERAGGIAAIRGALIDDCAFGALIKRHGRIWLGLTDRARSIRRYDTAGSIAAMISRSAYAQLDYAAWKLAGTIVGLGLIYAAPPLLAVLGSGPARMLGAAAWLAMAVSIQPMLRFYRRSPLWGPALPLIAAFYGACTLLSAWQHWQGRGGMWKGRAQAARG